jgi:hypothetical protein
VDVMALTAAHGAAVAFVLLGVLLIVAGFTRAVGAGLLLLGLGLLVLGMIVAGLQVLLRHGPASAEDF